MMYKLQGIIRSKWKLFFIRFLFFYFIVYFLNFVLYLFFWRGVFANSLALYPNSNRFCDFANGNYSGDIIGFISYIKGANNWQALKELQNYYGLTDSREAGGQEAQRRIQIPQQEERRKEERRQAFYRALWAQIDDLKRWEVFIGQA